MFIIAAPAKKKIFTVSMVKNEADIIETFVRYHLAIVDGMAILDNCSTDGTTQILGKLVQEGLPVYLVKDTDAAYCQAEKTTKLLYDTIERYHPDVVIPLDSDEFIYLCQGGNPRNYLEALEDNALYFLQVYDFHHQYQASDTEFFSLTNFTCRNQRESFAKVLFTTTFMQTYQFSLAEGNHDVSVPVLNHYIPFSRFHEMYRIRKEFQSQVTIHNNFPFSFDLEEFLRLNKRKSTYRRVYATEIALAHFPYRSREQMKSKICTGWLNVQARARKTQDHAIHYETRFNLLLRGEETAAFDGLFSQTRESVVPADLDLSYQPPLCCRYTPLKPVNSFANVLAAASQLAEAHARCQRDLEDREAECVSLRQYRQKYLRLLLDNICEDRQAPASIRELREYPIAMVADAIRQMPGGAPKGFLDDIARRMCELCGPEETLRWAEIDT